MLDKSMSAKDAVALVRDGDTVLFGGWGAARKPMAIVRELARSTVRDLTLVTMGGLDADMLIAAGKVRKVIYGFLGYQQLPGIPGRCRKARQDGSVEMVVELFPDVIVINNSENKGFAAANNQGIEKSTGKYVLLLNPDTKLYSDTLKKMIEFYDTHKDAGVLGCKILNNDGSLQSSCRNFPSIPVIFFETISLHFLYSKIKPMRHFYLMYWEHDRIRKVDSVKGACLMVPGYIVDKVGYLDENFFIYGEEVDWCKRINDAGFNNYFTPETKIIHFGGKSTEIKKQKNLIELQKSRVLYCKKHFISLSYKKLQLYS